MRVVPATMTGVVAAAPAASARAALRRAPRAPAAGAAAAQDAVGRGGSVTRGGGRARRDRRPLAAAPRGAHAWRAAQCGVPRRRARQGPSERGGGDSCQQFVFPRRPCHERRPSSCGRRGCAREGVAATPPSPPPTPFPPNPPTPRPLPHRAVLWPMVTAAVSSPAPAPPWSPPHHNPSRGHQG